MNRDDLKSYKYNQQWIKDRLEYLQSYRETIMKITTTISDMPKGSREIQDSMAEKLSKLIDSVNELLEKIEQENQKQKEILEQLAKVEQPYRLILEKVYIQGKTLVTVASEMNYNYEVICRKNGKALKIFEEKASSQ